MITTRRQLYGLIYKTRKAERRWWRRIPVLHARARISELVTTARHTGFSSSGSSRSVEMLWSQAAAWRVKRSSEVCKFSPVIDRACHTCTPGDVLSDDRPPGGVVWMLMITVYLSSALHIDFMIIDASADWPTRRCAHSVVSSLSVWRAWAHSSQHLRIKPYDGPKQLCGLPTSNCLGQYR